MTISQVREALRRHGPMTAEQMGQYIDLGKSCISAQTLSLREKKQVFIIGHKPRANGTQGRNAPIYALGNAPDAEDISRRMQARIKIEEAAKPPKKVDTFDKRHPGVRQSAGMWGALMG
jgi:hypothetical protein